MEKLLARKIKAPFLPKTNDPESMRKSQTKLVKLRELRESLPDDEKTNYIKEMN